MIATIQEMNGQFSPYIAMIDAHSNSLWLRSPKPDEFTAWINMSFPQSE